MTQRDLFEWHIDKMIREWGSLSKNDVMNAYEKAAEGCETVVKNLNLGVVIKSEALVCCANCKFIGNEMTEKPCNKCFNGHTKYKQRAGL